jgi:hypothetical protein
MKKHELLPRFNELSKMREMYACIPNPYLDEYIEITQRLISMYRKCIDLSEVSEEELEELDYQ